MSCDKIIEEEAVFIRNLYEGKAHSCIRAIVGINVVEV